MFMFFLELNVCELRRYSSNLNVGKIHKCEELTVSLGALNSRFHVTDVHLFYTVSTKKTNHRQCKIEMSNLNAS